MPLPTTLEPWEDRLLDLARRIRTEVRGAVVRAAGAGGLEALSRAVGRGEGDETFALDAISERVVGEWLVEVAAEGLGMTVQTFVAAMRGALNLRELERLSVVPLRLPRDSACMCCSTLRYCNTSF